MIEVKTKYATVHCYGDLTPESNLYCVFDDEWFDYICCSGWKTWDEAAKGIQAYARAHLCPTLELLQLEVD